MSILDGNQNSGGDKRTIIAVILSVVIITVGFTLQGIFFPTPKREAPPVSPPALAAPVPSTAQQPAALPSGPAQGIVAATGTGAAVVAKGRESSNSAATSLGVPSVEQTYTVSTDLIEAVFTNKGGDLLSLKLKKYRDKAGAVDLIVPDAKGSQGLSVAFGGTNGMPIKDLMNVRMIDPETIEFSRTYLATVPGKPAPVPFTYRKTFSFRNGEYLFGMTIGLENSVNEYLPLDEGGDAYTVSFGPQIGPTLDVNARKANGDYRKFITLVDGKKRQEKPKQGLPYVVKNQPSWIALSGKYFTFITIPELSDFGTTITTAPDPETVQQDDIAISRPTIRASTQSDAFFFYFGPKTNSALAKYNYADQNAFHKSDMKLDEAMDGVGMLTWLENILKFALNVFYGLIPNYGVAIILVTILVKALLFPLTRKGSVSASRMQELQPKMQEIQAKYKGNPQKLNQELAEFLQAGRVQPYVGLPASSYSISDIHRHVQSLQQSLRSARRTFHPRMDTRSLTARVHFQLPDDQSGDMALERDQTSPDYLPREPASVWKIYADERGRAKRLADEAHDVRHAHLVLLHSIRCARRFADLLDRLQRPFHRAANSHQ